MFSFYQTFFRLFITFNILYFLYLFITFSILYFLYLFITFTILYFLYLQLLSLDYFVKSLKLLDYFSLVLIFTCVFHQPAKICSKFCNVFQQVLSFNLLSDNCKDFCRLIPKAHYLLPCYCKFFVSICNIQTKKSIFGHFIQSKLFNTLFVFRTKYTILCPYSDLQNLA